MILLSAMFICRGYAKVQQPIKVACLGASITYGSRIENREQNSYPAQLQRMLGDRYQVVNYGVAGTTLLQSGDHPYGQTTAYKTALAANPDIVIIDLGGNDAKLINRVHLESFRKDYHELIESFKQLRSHPRIILLTAMASFVTDTMGVWDPVLIKQINPLVQQVAYDNKVEVIDMHSPFVDKAAHFSDKLHPDAAGAAIMALNVYRVLAISRDSTFHLVNKLNITHNTSSYYGYTCADFKFNGRNCKIVEPKAAAKGHPWIWRARFWGHEPQTEIALLQLGYHVVYCDVAELLGNQESVSLWDKFYDLVHEKGLARMATMEGMSRGGLYVFNWAAENPGKVMAVYVDNPLLNIPSWALNYPLDSNDPMYAAFKKDYQISTKEDITTLKQSPVDKINQIVKGEYPILILCADADEAVDPQQNTMLFEKRIRESGGRITVIHKPGFKHHPHSFPNPEVIVQFLFAAFNASSANFNMKTEIK